MFLRGHRFTSGQSLKLGMIDGEAPKEQMFEAAKALATKMAPKASHSGEAGKVYAYLKRGSHTQLIDRHVPRSC